MFKCPPQHAEREHQRSTISTIYRRAIALKIKLVISISLIRAIATAEPSHYSQYLMPALQFLALSHSK